jgi:hypothetical protein
LKGFHWPDQRRKYRETKRTTEIEKQLHNIIGNTQTIAAAKEDVVGSRLHDT